ncbi:hypothetical protein PQX77_019010, partial [Marasmius sp. AFHP31]
MIHYNLGLHEEEEVRRHAENFRCLNPFVDLGGVIDKETSGIDAVDFYTEADKEFVKEVWCAAKNKRLEE